MADRFAVLVKNADKHYGRKGKTDYKVVLENLHMTVEKGTIYGLLGPSGCGKSTLLSCLVGRRQLNKGDVWVLGGKPGERGSGVPGPRVGYMPQEIALVGEFTIHSALFYFGRIYGMSESTISERIDFLTNLLELPDNGNMVKNLSGGQQRRVSLACALIHEPELLILDEPTVGLDPILREKIWDFLTEQARSGTTVIITTHYIDETKQADRIGLLRGGRLLAEDTPTEILRQYECTTLEEAFLKMALRQSQELRWKSIQATSPDLIMGGRLSQPSSHPQPFETDFDPFSKSTDILAPKKSYVSIRSKRYKAVFFKSMQQFTKQPTGLIFSAIFPIIQLVAFFWAVGQDPYDLKVAVVNEEVALSPLGFDVCTNSKVPHVILDEHGDTCDLFLISCWFLDEMEKQKLYRSPCNSTEEARTLVLNGKYYAGIHFMQNFSEYLGSRMREAILLDEDIINNGTIHVWIDMTNYQISNFVKIKVYEAFRTFAKRVMLACGREERVSSAPLLLRDPVWGDNDSQYVTFMAPGIMVTIVFFLASVLTSTVMISERLEGVWERSAVAGVRSAEMLQVHVFIHSLVIVVQSAEIMLLAFFVYDLPAEGSAWTLAILMCLQGLSGMCYGFLLSVICSSYTMAFFIATGSFYPMILLCGVLWPLEAMPNGLRIFSHLLPFTFPIQGLRDLMIKGLELTDPSIYIAYGVTILWIGITLSLCFIVLKMKKS